MLRGAATGIEASDCESWLNSTAVISKSLQKLSRQFLPDIFPLIELPTVCPVQPGNRLRRVL